jgi:hypothetical protein
MCEFLLKGFHLLPLQWLWGFCPLVAAKHSLYQDPLQILADVVLLYDPNGDIYL